MTIITTGVNTFSTTDTTFPASGAFTPAAGDLLVAFMMLSPMTAATWLNFLSGTLRNLDTGVSGSLGWDTIGYSREGNNRGIWIVIATRPAAPVSGTLQGNRNGVGTGSAICVYRIPNMSKFGSAAVRQVGFQNDGGAAATPTVVLPAACLTANPVLGAVANATNPAAITPPAGWTETVDSGYATPTSGGEVAVRNSGETGSTITWGGASATAFCAAVVELNLAGTLTADDAERPESGWGGLQ